MRIYFRMKIHNLLFICLFSALCDGKVGLVNAKNLTRAEGGSVTAVCQFSFSGRKKFLCREECKDGDVLIETHDNAVQRGRYSITYEEGTFPVSSTFLYVSIAQLKKSDSGRYLCGLERPLLPDSYEGFELQVTDAPKSEKARHPDRQQSEENAVAIYSSKGYVPPLAVCITVLFAAASLLLYKLKTRVNSDCLTSWRQSDNENNNKSTDVNLTLTSLTEFLRS
ncbi:uncharacterized protein LOC125022653 [Mugil cephalus]|uniref:uncharacterized protein LOC125022653 n=1 Tax=Mugil cephalus TaxID=48193 RepID=UPI001FB64DAC|nr:uncharacterized protein LOC125022653 [Mugil cephalus]